MSRLANEGAAPDRTIVDEDRASGVERVERASAAPTDPPEPAVAEVPHAHGTGSYVEALDHDERQRTKRFCMIVIVIAVVVLAAILVLPTIPIMSSVFALTNGLAIAASGFMIHRTRHPEEFQRPSTMVGWFVLVLCITPAIPYFGPFSPVPMLMVLAIYFTALGRSRAVALVVYAASAIGQLLATAVSMAAWFPDNGLIHAASLSLFDQAVIQGLVQFMLLITFVTARMSRQTSIVAVRELERAVRLAAHRDALLLEARQELARAKLSSYGRFTGQSLAGYDLGIVIGRGAMGEIYESTDPLHRTRVAIKLLSQTSLSNPTHVERFLREQRAIALIDSPYVVRVIAIGTEPVPYLVMERLEGLTLQEILRGRWALSVPEIIELLRQVGAGITTAASVGIVHRDLKPQNLFWDRGVWKILDFGVSRAIDGGETLTAGAIVGTPAYMAPEQARGETVDHCSDLYALSAIAYRVLTGHPPFVTGELADTIYRVVHTPPRRPSELAPHLPRAVDAVLSIGLAKLPRDRFSSATELVDALIDALQGKLSSVHRARAAALQHDAWLPGASKRSDPRATTRQTTWQYPIRPAQAPDAHERER